MRRLGVLFGCLVNGAFAEVFSLLNVPMPRKWSLSSHYLFHIYATAPEGSTVTFKSFEIEWPDGKVGIDDYRSLQLSLVPWSNFRKLIDRTGFCSLERKIIFKEATTAPVFTIGSKKEATFPILATGQYLLTITNCGSREGATIKNGDVIVTQPHGYLPGNKIWTLQWWGWFTLANAILFIIWLIGSLRHYKALVYVQKVIAACATVALLEASMGYVHHKEWNKTGTQNSMLMAGMMLLYSLRYVVTLHMLIEVASGSGITMERLEVSVGVKVDLVCSVFLVMQWIWKVVLSHKYSLMLSQTFMFLITIPGTLLWFILFFWIYRKLNELLATLRDKKLADEVVTLFFNMRLVLIGSILLATVVLIVQFADIVLATTPWNLQWVAYDAAPHAVYTLFLLALMILWWPHADSWKYAYHQQVNQDESGIGPDGKVEAEQIGLAEPEEL
jgi:hypothetical protein